ncbi:acyltransferase [Bacteroides sp.]|uniref:acyltransferase n=1 Tax=Bacteroides sp. TaxID=29523 RepID=UPI002A8293A8|nr:acyltransferase [Bacteroides sp.]
MMMKRIFELDYMRGIAMLFVVVGHILEFGLNADRYPHAFMGIVQMPLFFIVSGYLAYRNKEQGGMDTLHRFLIRSRILLVPLVVWSVILNVCKGEITCSQAMICRGGYWFFLALWWCDLFNTCINYFSKRYRLHLFMDVVLYMILYVVILLLRIKGVNLGGLLPIQNVQYYFLIYALGILMHKYTMIHKWVLNKYTYAIGLITILVAWYLLRMQSFPIYFLGGVGGVIVFWMICKEIPFEKKWAKALSIVGKNTLPIYAIHYLFITTLPQCLHDAVNVPMGFFLQFVIAFTYAVVVVILCLIIDRIISVNPITRMVFFGESKKREW